MSIMSNKNIKKRFMLYLSILLLSMSLILSYIEAILPFDMGYIGAKIGLANIITLISLHILDIKWTLIINILRLLIISLIFPNAIRLILSFAGFLTSFLIMILLLKKFHFSIITSSIFGAVTHNVIQVICVSILIKNSTIIKSIPFYIIIGIFAGLIIGIISEKLYKKIIIIHLNK